MNYVATAAAAGFVVESEVSAAYKSIFFDFHSYILAISSAAYSGSLDSSSWSATLWAILSWRYSCVGSGAVGSTCLNSHGSIYFNSYRRYMTYVKASCGCWVKLALVSMHTFVARAPLSWPLMHRTSTGLVSGLFINSCTRTDIDSKSSYGFWTSSHKTTSQLKWLSISSNFPFAK